MRTPLIAGNWKMHKSISDGRELALAIRDATDRMHGNFGVEVLLCPPFPLLFPISEVLLESPVMLGAQNAHESLEGAFTGEVSVPMLKDAGCTHVIIGHSERRQHFHEDGPRLAKKVRAVQSGGLQCIYCVGETLEDRDGGETESVLERQIAEVVGGDLNADRLILAYEPVWAIGTGRTATPEQAQDVHSFIRGRLTAILGGPAAESIRILYGGSVKAGNAVGLLDQPDIDGALVGGASLESDEFVGIISAAGQKGS